jgi:hypothetical protein
MERVAKWFTNESDANSYAKEKGLSSHWFGGKEMWLVCSENEWNAVIRGDIIIC